MTERRGYVPTGGFTQATERTRAFKEWGIGTDPGVTPRVLSVLGTPYGFAPATEPSGYHRGIAAYAQHLATPTAE